MSYIIHIGRLRNHHMRLNHQINKLILACAYFTLMFLVLSTCSKFFFILTCTTLIFNFILVLTKCYFAISIVVKNKKITKLLDNYIVNHIKSILKDYPIDTILATANVNLIDSHHYTVVVECKDIAQENIYLFLEDLKHNIFYATKIRLFITYKPFI